MKILHTSDWHIGKKLYKQDIEEDHKHFFKWLITTINSQNIDILLISGDIFDIAYPSNKSLSLYYEFLTDLLKTNCKNIIITGGNHDSVSTLEAPKDILKLLNVNVIGGLSENVEDLIFNINIENEEAIICAVPFLRDSDIRKSIPGESYGEKQKSIHEGIAEYYKQVAEIADTKNKNKSPLIAMGHLFVTGVSRSDSERDIHIGNLDGLRIEKLPNLFDYWALGHIHRPQIINKNENIRYSGSPIPLSFSERDDKKQVVVIEILENRIQSVEPIFVDTYKNLIRIAGTYEEVLFKIKLQEKKEFPDRADILIIEKNYIPSIINEFTDFVKIVENIDILNFKIIFEDKIHGSDEIFDETRSLSDIKVEDVFLKKLEKENVPEDEKEELILAFNEIYNTLI